MSRAKQFYGAGIDRMFPRDWDSKEPALKAGAPWPPAGRSKQFKDYDEDKVREVLSNPERQHVAPQDPTDPSLRSTQPEVTRAGVQHYMSDEYRQKGALFADQTNPGNVTPVIYHRSDGQSLTLSGHHRGAAALLRGEQFNAIHVHGGYGPPRQG